MSIKLLPVPCVDAIYKWYLYKLVDISDSTLSYLMF